ncbi:hypothetical protein QCA50_020335 [Cerrena zonata]|uniref:C2 domain-containing protein n=1 Tax=Cerrena zonata TaxID=2478898 RepID=A0AAW0F895_9APHY
MARTVTLKVHRVSDVRLKKRFKLLGLKPKLYVEIRIKNGHSKQSFKTKKIRGTDVQWDEEFMLHSIEESQTMRISLKSVTFFGKHAVGEIECKALDVLSRGTASLQNSLKVYRPGDKVKICPTGTITVTAKYSDSEPGPQVPSLNENKAQNAHDVDLPLLPSEAPLEPPGETQDSPSGPLEPLANIAETPALTEELPMPKEEAETRELPEEKAQRLFAGAQVSVANELSPDSLYGKVGKVLDKLELLRGIVGKIEELAKLHPWSDLAWQVCTSMFKVVKKQQSTDTKIIDLVTKIEATLDFVDDADKIKSDAILLRPIIEELLKQVAECATFICTYLQSSFASTSSPDQ